MLLPKKDELNNEENASNKIVCIRQRPKPEIITSEALKKSIEIISKYDYKFTTEEHIIEYNTCFSCQNNFPTIKGKEYSCQKCDETFCVKHRDVLNHHCRKLDPNLERILAAKSLFKERMRMLKMRGHK